MVRPTCCRVCWGRGISARPVALQRNKARLALSNQLLHLLRRQQVLWDVHVLWCIHLHSQSGHTCTHAGLHARVLGFGFRACGSAVHRDVLLLPTTLLPQ